jgi:hypothetical protein
MKILIIGPSPYMKHDPGLMVNDFIKLASKDRQVFGCFYHHDFSKLPLENTNEFHYGSGSVDAKWIDNSQENAAVIAAYDAIMEWEIDCIVSFGSYIEADFIRAAKETSGREIAWHHVLTMANHVHDVRYAETFNNIDFIYSFSESQLENIVSTLGVLKDKLCVLEKPCKVTSSNSEKTVDILCGGWNTESYNFKSIFESVAGLSASFKCLTNYYEYGDYDLEAMKNCYFNNQEIYPSDFASLFEKPAYEQWDHFIENCKIFIDMSMSQGSCSTAKTAHASGAFCFLIDTPRHRELSRYFSNIRLIKSSVFFSSSGIKMYVPDHLDLHMQLVEYLSNSSNLSRKYDIYDNYDKKEGKDLEYLLNNIIQADSAGRCIGIESIT